MGDILIREAQKSNVKKQYVAVLMHRNKVLSIGYNYLRPNVSQTKSCVL